MPKSVAFDVGLDGKNTSVLPAPPRMLPRRLQVRTLVCFFYSKYTRTSLKCGKKSAVPVSPFHPVLRKLVDECFCVCELVDECFRVCVCIQILFFFCCSLYIFF